MLDQIADELGDTVKITKVDVDKDANQPLAQKFGVQNIPTILFFKNGVVVDKVVGSRPKADPRRHHQEAWLSARDATGRKACPGLGARLLFFRSTKYPRKSARPAAARFSLYAEENQPLEPRPCPPAIN